jgi:hypothetical protein
MHYSWVFKNPNCHQDVTQKLLTDELCWQQTTINTDFLVMFTKCDHTKHEPILTSLYNFTFLFAQFLYWVSSSFIESIAWSSRMRTGLHNCEGTRSHNLLDVKLSLKMAEYWQAETGSHFVCNSWLSCTCISKRVFPLIRVLVQKIDHFTLHVVCCNLISSSCTYL